MKNSESSAGGYIMLALLVALLGAPLAVSHFVLAKPAAVTVHADASAAQ